MTLQQRALSSRDREAIPQLGDAVPKRGNWATRGVARLILRLAGWRIEGQVPDLPKFLIIGAPHTSNWDYILTLLTMFALGGDMKYVAKSAMFANPLGGLFRWLGGISLDRSKSQGFVDQMVAQFDKRDQLVVAIMPEGSRSKVKEWRSGFYYIALGARVPIFLVAFDYGTRLMRLGPAITPGGDYAIDLPLIQSHFTGIRGKNA